MKKLFLRAEFGPLWEPWEVDETPRKFFWEGREKSWPCWLSQFSFALPSQRNFPISFKPKVAIAR